MLGEVCEPSHLARARCSVCNATRRTWSFNDLVFTCDSKMTYRLALRRWQLARLCRHTPDPILPVRTERI